MSNEPMTKDQRKPNDQSPDGIVGTEGCCGLHIGGKASETWPSGEMEIRFVLHKVEGMVLGRKTQALKCGVNEKFVASVQANSG